MKIHKYMKIEHAIDALEHGIYAGTLDSFNDPYEYEGILYPDLYRVCCLTGSDRKMLLWAHYANHSECCVGFDVNENDVRQVKYTTDYYQRREMSQEEVLENLFVKAKEWDYENEYRIICEIENYDALKWNKIGESYFFKAKVTELIFGLKTNFSNENSQRLLKYLKRYNENRDNHAVDVKKCMLSDKRYEIIFNKQFDYRREITG